MSEYPQRTCTGCGQTDDHPRHDTVLFDQATGEVRESSWHLDCHARLTPPCQVCLPQVEKADGKTGEDMRQHILAHHATEGQQ